MNAIKDRSRAFSRLEHLCLTYGSRYSGSASLERAIDWTLNEMKADGLDNVHGEEVTIPRWIRGQVYQRHFHYYQNRWYR
jgi:carboxypeptidase Q